MCENAQHIGSIESSDDDIVLFSLIEFRNRFIKRRKSCFDHFMSSEGTLNSSD